jgi:hypothetical protein
MVKGSFCNAISTTFVESTASTGLVGLESDLRLGVSLFIVVAGTAVFVFSGLAASIKVFSFGSDFSAVISSLFFLLPSFHH